jgi:hypothetical protein
MSYSHRGIKPPCAAFWHCCCLCGNTTTVSTGALKRIPGTKSCGCLKRERSGLTGRLNVGKIGPQNTCWKGGKHTDKDGYIQASIKFHYPDLVLFYPTRYRIPEHDAIMSRYVSRALLPDETVHHKNGIRDDNRLDNLEIWSSKHPKGQRAQDQIEWAIHILSRYAPERIN